VISEVFLDVWRQAGRFEGRSTVSTWLLAIARFKAISALRRRPDEELDEEAAAAIEDLSDNPATALEKILTGDARGDKILEGLELVGLLEKGGNMHVDVLKVPHHGSDNNMAPIFFTRVTADHYVFSGRANMVIRNVKP
jgi:hypothetical protein